MKSVTLLFIFIIAASLSEAQELDSLIITVTSKKDVTFDARLCSSNIVNSSEAFMNDSVIYINERPEGLKTPYKIVIARGEGRESQFVFRANDLNEKLNVRIDTPNGSFWGSSNVTAIHIHGRRITILDL